jgi:hypothetical protein
MSEQDPTRLKDDASGGSETLRALFAAGAADLPSPDELARVAAKLGPVLTPPAAGGATAGGGTMLKVGVAALAIGAGALLVSTFGARKPSAPVNGTAVNGVRVVPPSAGSPSQPSAPVEVSPTPGSAEAAPAPASVEASSSPAPAARNAAPAAAESEASFLERARATLATNPTRALALANLHRSRYPSGVLAQEREVIAIEALKRLGRADEAARRSGDFKSRYPGSAYGRKLDAGTSP